MRIIKIASSLNINILGDFSDIEYYREYHDDGLVEKNCDDQVVKKLILESLKNIYTEFDSSGFDNLKRRYSFDVVSARDGWKDIIFNVKFSPLGDGEEEYASEDDPNYEYYKMKGGKTGRSLYKEPKNAIEEIPVSLDLMYRGMSWEEWKSINKTGVIQSKGSYNLGQEGLTFFSPSPSSAQSYSSGFTHFQNEITPKTPGVVISVPKKHALTSKDRRDIPDSELAISGSLPSTEIEEVWFLIPVSQRTLSGFDIVIPWKKFERYEDGEKITGWVLNPEKSRTGSGNFSLSTQYKIIRKK